MTKMQKLKKQGGFAITSELVFLVTIVVIGLTVGMVNIRDAVTAEMSDVAESVGSMDQSYSFDGILNGQTTAEVAGSAFGDQVDAFAGDGVTWTYELPAATEQNGAVSANVDAAVTGQGVSNGNQ